MASLFYLWYTCQKGGFANEEIVEALEPLDARGGSHDDDWRCPSCRHFNSEKRRARAKCEAVAPMNGRRTRKALRERAAEHRNAAILGKHGL